MNPIFYPFVKLIPEAVICLCALLSNILLCDYIPVSILFYFAVHGELVAFRNKATVSISFCFLA